jgi:cytochrome b561
LAGADVNDMSKAGFRQFSPVIAPDLEVSVAAALNRKPARSGKPRNNPRSDIGTILIHWTAAIACLVSLFTGLRLAADAEGSVIIRFFSPVLPQGEMWTWHVFAGLTLFFASSAYVLYLHRSGLQRRVALSKVKALTLPAASKVKWGAVNVLLHWALYAALLVMTATGIALYLGYGGWLVTVHSVTAVGTLFYIIAHVIGHYG